MTQIAISFGSVFAIPGLLNGEAARKPIAHGVCHLLGPWKYLHYRKPLWDSYRLLSGVQKHSGIRTEWPWRAHGIAKTPLRLAQNDSGGPLGSPKPFRASRRMALEGPWNRQNTFAPRTGWLWRGPGVAKTPLRLAQNRSQGPLESPKPRCASLRMILEAPRSRPGGPPPHMLQKNDFPQLRLVAGLRMKMQARFLRI